MRIVLVAIGLVVLLAVGWVLKGLMSDRDERDFAVHYSWIVKWALTLSRETGRTPAGANFNSPRIEVAGHANRWVLSGHLSWRNALGEPVSESYTTVVENVCKAYADADCWRLESFATGAAAIDLAERTLADADQAVGAPEGPAPASAAQDTGSATTVAIADAAPKPAATPDPVLSLLEDPAPAAAGASVPAAPMPPVADGIPLPERKPVSPMRNAEALAQAAAEAAFAEADSLAVLTGPSASAASEADSAAALADSAPLADEADSRAAIADAGAIAGDTDSAAALGETEPVAAADAVAAVEEAAPLAGVATAGPTAMAGEQLASAATPAPAPAAPSAPVLQPSLAPAASAAPAPEASRTPVAPLPSTTVAALPQQPLPAPQPGIDPALVALIQDRLDRAGYDPGPIDGRFGGRTQTALMEFERDAGLPVRGHPSRETLAALDRRLAAAKAPAPQPSAQTAALPTAAAPQSPTPNPVATSAAPAKGAPAAPPAGQPVNLIQPVPSQPAAAAADESLIFLIQHRLRQAGFSPGRFDGRMNEGTASAIRAYQAKNGLPVNGIPSRALLQRLEGDVLNGRQTQPSAPTPLGFLFCTMDAPACAPPPA